MGKIYSVEEVRRILDMAGTRMGLPCRDVPVEVSTRMKRTYGSFIFRIVEGEIRPVAFRFAHKLLSGDYPPEVVEHTILHEYAHFYTNLTGNRNHGHDARFKEICRRLGISPVTRFTGNHEEEVRKGYRIYCTKCRNEVARRRRSDSARAIAGKYLSGCCRARLKLKADRF